MRWKICRHKGWSTILNGRARSQLPMDYLSKAKYRFKSLDFTKRFSSSVLNSESSKYRLFNFCLHLINGCRRNTALVHHQQFSLHLLSYHCLNALIVPPMRSYSVNGLILNLIFYFAFVANIISMDIAYFNFIILINTSFKTTQPSSSTSTCLPFWSLMRCLNFCFLDVIKFITIFFVKRQRLIIDLAKRCMRYFTDRTDDTPTISSIANVFLKVVVE